MPHFANFTVAKQNFDDIEPDFHRRILEPYSGPFQVLVITYIIFVWLRLKKIKVRL